MSELSDEERKLLAEAGTPRRGRSVARPTPAGSSASTPAERGDVTPVQYDDDGWGDTPIQMRG